MIIMCFSVDTIQTEMYTHSTVIFQEFSLLYLINILNTTSGLRSDFLFNKTTSPLFSVLPFILCFFPLNWHLFCRPEIAHYYISGYICVSNMIMMVCFTVMTKVFLELEEIASSYYYDFGFIIPHNPFLLH